MTTTRDYRSTDSGAPTLTGQVGSLNALLKACLVGVSGVAYGSKAAAGWTVAYEDLGAHKLVLRNSLAAGGTGCYVRIDDSGSTAGGAREAVVRVYATMSDIDTGTSVIPGTAVQPSGSIWRKSLTLDATARPWLISADELTVYLNALTGTDLAYFGGAGDFESFVPADDFRYFVSGGVGTNACQANLVMTGVNTLESPTVSGGRGNWTGRRYQLDDVPEQFSVPALGVQSAAGAAAGSAITGVNIHMGGNCAPMADPSAGTSLRSYHPAFVGQQRIIRGRLRGLYVPLNDLRGLAWGAVDATPANAPPGAEFLIAKCTMANNTSDFYRGTLAIDVVSEW